MGYEPTGADSPPPEIKWSSRPSDDVLGEKWIELHEGQFAVIYDVWHRYENGVWKPDKKSPRIAAWELLKTAKSVGIKPTATAAENILVYAALYLPTPPPPSRDYINVQNGVINLKTLELEPHRHNLYMTSQLPFPYIPRAESLEWEKFLGGIIGTDFKLERFIQQAFGYSLTTNTDQRCSFWLVGASGTGKSTLMNVLIELAGDGHTNVELERLDDDYQMSKVPGKTLVTFSEPKVGSYLPDGAYKRLVSQDSVTARRPYGEPFTFVPTAKVWGSMNQAPRVNDRSDAVFNRVHMIPIKRVIPAEERDPELINKLKGEMSGILWWSLQGLVSLRERGRFDVPDVVKREGNEFRKDNDTEAAFLEEVMVQGEGLTVSFKDLYSYYKNWCKEGGLVAKGRNIIGREWERLGLVRSATRQANGYIYPGWGLRSEL